MLMSLRSCYFVTGKTLSAKRISLGNYFFHVSMVADIWIKLMILVLIICCKSSRPPFPCQHDGIILDKISDLSS